MDISAVMSSPARRSTSLNPQLPQIAEEDYTEPFRRDIDRTLGIDATRPQRNAFAEEGLRVHRHRLAGNAFYQEAFIQKKNTPPTVLHPALRYNTDLYDISQALPEYCEEDMENHRPSFEMQEISPHHARISSTTTMSRFINTPFEDRATSPGLRLEPTPNATQEPTFRDHLEERGATAGFPENRDDHIISTRYSPTVRDFGHHSHQFQGGDGTRPPTSPKKSLLDRFRVSSRRGGVPIHPLPAMEAPANMPAKAKAVLVTAPPNRSLPRSPSKTKGFWSRRKPSISEDAGNTSPAPVFKQPPRPVQPTLRTNGLPGFSSSHSMGCEESPIPPTPPSKDTPPEEKARYVSASASTSFLDESTPTRNPAAGFFSLGSRTSPNKCGGYSKRSNPTLVMQPSVRSLRASVVPAIMDEHDFEETMARMDGLGLAGLGVPHEHRMNLAQYSPSVYSPDVGMGVFTPFRHKKSKSSSDAGFSDMGNISVIYPDLERDRSITSFMTPPNKTIAGTDIVSNSDRNYAEMLRQGRRPTIRRDGIDVVIHQVDDMLQGGGTSPSDSSLFAIPLGNTSAQVSPLHLQPAVFKQNESQQRLPDLPDLQPIMVNNEGQQILPATTYNPWDVQQQSNHSPYRGPRSSRGISPQPVHKKSSSTTVMPGLAYDSGVDVDPEKLLANKTSSSKHSRTSRASWSPAPRSEKNRVGIDSFTDVPEAAGLNAAKISETRDNNIKELIASFQQNEIGERLSNIEESIKRDALSKSINDVEERRKLEQEVLFDHRIASLEIERFSREPSPINCYEDSAGRRHRTSISPSHSLKDRKSPRHRHLLSSTQSPDQRPDAKRISSDEAKGYYQNQLKDSPVMNSGNVDKPALPHVNRASPEAKKRSRVQAADAAPHVPTLLQESAKIRQLQWKVDRQNEWIQATMARMEAIEAKYQGKKRDDED